MRVLMSCIRISCSTIAVRNRESSTCAWMGLSFPLSCLSFCSTDYDSKRPDCSVMQEKTTGCLNTHSHSRSQKWPATARVMLFSLFVLIIIVTYCLYRRRQWVAQFADIPGVTNTYFGLIGDAVLFARVINRHNYRNAAPALQAVSGFCKSIPHNGLIKLWFGPVLMLMLTSADAVEAVLSSTAITRKGIHYTFLEPWLGSGLLTSHGNQWRRNRKMLTPTFHFKILEEFVPVMNKNGRILIQKLDQEAEQNDGVIKDLRPFILRAALDVICETAMGEEVRAQDDPDSQYIRAVYR